MKFQFFKMPFFKRARNSLRIGSLKAGLCLNHVKWRRGVVRVPDACVAAVLARAIARVARSLYRKLNHGLILIVNGKVQFCM